MSSLANHQQFAEALIVRVRPELYVPLARQLAGLRQCMDVGETALRRFQSSKSTAQSHARTHQGKNLPEAVRSDMSVYAEKKLFLEAGCADLEEQLAACDQIIEDLIYNPSTRIEDEKVRYYNLIRAMKLSREALCILDLALNDLQGSPDFSNLLADDYHKMLDEWHDARALSAQQRVSRPGKTPARQLSPSPGEVVPGNFPANRSTPTYRLRFTGDS